MSAELTTYADLSALVTHFRVLDKKYVLLFGYNGTGKTRLSMDFRQAGKSYDADGNVIERDTLYFNAFTEDLFYWDNDLVNDTERVLKLNKDSRFFDGLQELEMDNKIRPLLHRYSTFNFLINYVEGSVNFIREEIVDGTAQNVEHIKISRGEENIFIWCFFLAIAQLAIDRQEAYDWVKYIYIDDPVSSLDDNNTIAIAHHLASILKAGNGEIKTIISSHHALFFNVLHNEFGNRMPKYFLSKSIDGYALRNTNDSPFFYHVSLIQEIRTAINTGTLYTYHFNILRTILEKAANFHGYNGFSDCIEVDDDDENKTLHARLVNILNHGSYSLFEPREMGEENKIYFKQIFDNFLSNYKFNEQLFEEAATIIEETTSPIAEATIPVETMSAAQNVSVEERATTAGEVVASVATTTSVSETVPPVEETTTATVAEALTPIEETTPAGETVMTVEETSMPVEVTTLPIEEASNSAEEEIKLSEEATNTIRESPKKDT